MFGQEAIDTQPAQVPSPRPPPRTPATRSEAHARQHCCSEEHRRMRGIHYTKVGPKSRVIESLTPVSMPYSPTETTSISPRSARPQNIRGWRVLPRPHASEQTTDARGDRHRQALAPAAGRPAPGAHEGAHNQRFSSSCSGSEVFRSLQQENLQPTTRGGFFLNPSHYTTGAKSSARSSSSNSGPSLLCSAPPSRIEAARSALRACRSRMRSSTVPAHTSL